LTGRGGSQIVWNCGNLSNSLMKEDAMPALGLSQNKFKIGHQHTFQVFGNNLGSADVTDMTTNVPNVAWQIISTTAKSLNHVSVKAKLDSTPSAVHMTDTIGDLTITVTDSGTMQTATTTFTPVTYQT
jgi:hypothetical protein